MNNIVGRIINVLKSPKTEWPVIATEPATIGSLYVPYVLALAAVGPLANLLGGGGFGTFRLGSSFLLRTSITSYLVSLVSVAVLAWLINILAPTFGAQKNLIQAFKTAVYASTAAWIAGIGGLLGVLGTIVSLAGAVYSVYLLYLGLPHTMKAPPGRATGYTVVIIVAAIVLSIVLGAVGAAIGGTRAGLMGGFGGIASKSDDGPVFDADSALGRLERAGREMEKAEKEGRTQDPGQALGAVMGALGGSSTPVEALSADTLKGFMPDTLVGLPRQSISAERNAMLGMQISNAKARYGEGNSRIVLEITDTGGAAGMMALAGWANIEQSSEEGTRTERTSRANGRMVHEVWDSAEKRGEYSLVLGNRFLVKAEGSASELGDLKSALDEIDLAKLESLKGEGVKPAQ